MHQMHVPVFINSSHAIHKEDTLCCYPVICKADRQNFSYSYCRLENWPADSLQTSSLHLRVQVFLRNDLSETEWLQMREKGDILISQHI